MHQDDETILRFTKEILVKFIELGRVSPAEFENQFKSVFWTIKNTVVNAQIAGLDEDLKGEEPEACPKSNTLNEELCGRIAAIR